MNNGEKPFWTSKGNLFWAALALLMLGTHALISHRYPAFTPPATPDKPDWMRAALYGELVVHIVFLGAVITGIRNSIPSLNRPNYSDDGTLDIGSSQPSRQAAGRWGEVAAIALEFGIYLAVWARMYGIG
jgi:hypothetical protein